MVVLAEAPPWARPGARPARILMVTAELHGFARTGGLGDAVDGLARALARLGLDVAVVTPRYGVTQFPATVQEWPDAIPAEVGWGPGAEHRVRVFQAKAHGLANYRVCAVDHALFARAGLYGDHRGPYGDNALRFALLGRAALSVGDRLWGPLHRSTSNSPPPNSPPSVERGGGPDVLHCHDWHAALSIVYARSRMGPLWRSLPAVLNIHNLAFQGTVPVGEVDRLGIPRSLLRGDVLEHFGMANVLKAAVALADRTVTVSHGYRDEALTAEHGAGLDGFLRDQGPRFTAIENGIDDEAYDPATDPQLAARFDVHSAPMARRSNKALLVRDLGMSVEETTPLFAVVSRFAWQKGIDLLLPHVHELVANGAAFVFVGTGDTALECAARDAERRNPGRVVARIGFDDRLARRIYGGADFVVVPSRFEPCGLTQLYAMRYGAIPVVTPVGGLRDTVTDVRIATPSGTPLGTGFVAKAVSPEAVRDACRTALDFYRDPDQMADLVRRAMARDSSWSRAARAYERIYAECTKGWYGA